MANLVAENPCAALTVVLAVIVPSVVMTCMSFHRLHTTEVGLDYNTFWERVDKTVYDTPGLHFLGLPHRFIRFPKVVQTMQYNEEDHDILHTRTSDGLPVTLGLSFQFRYDTAKVYDLYMTFGGKHLQVMDNEARAVIANVACNYTAYKFFSEKQSIALAMQTTLNRDFVTKMFASVDALQIESIELPWEFQNAILESIKVKQNILAQTKYRENMDVTFAQDLMVAENNKNQTVTIAHGGAQQVMQEAMAEAVITNATVDAQIQAYGAGRGSTGQGDGAEMDGDGRMSSCAHATCDMLLSLCVFHPTLCAPLLVCSHAMVHTHIGRVRSELGFEDDSDQLLRYIWWESQKQMGRESQANYLVGVSQATVMKGGFSQCVASCCGGLSTTTVAASVTPSQAHAGNGCADLIMMKGGRLANGPCPPGPTDSDARGLGAPHRGVRARRGGAACRATRQPWRDSELVQARPAARADAGSTAARQSSRTPAKCDAHQDQPKGQSTLSLSLKRHAWPSHRTCDMVMRHASMTSTLVIIDHDDMHRAQQRHQQYRPVRTSSYK
eukprot:CAMPEP_0185212190 /NCGR_PEP_ID=MMETSP1140-20130426/67403_1 /TAXON_ID=298111 /ORGANISM="Pavlova sp., Strain CCMP459" /LENGTH=554 /DNA_ID=CAMNT_0027780041 /DNA_START=25 /DNA_END=1692 /DNA_ORIENTATION=-